MIMISQARPLAMALAACLAGGCGGDGGGSGAQPASCTGFAPAVTSPYRLPWHIGQTYRASPHLARESSVQRYAIDVAMPIGTEILAIRAGTVVSIEESFFDGDNVFGHENHVFVQHDDGTVARYLHLTNRGALVQVGDVVRQGQQLGLSGHTGNSSEPHLHFDVTRSCCTPPPDYNAMPAGETLPLTFQNAAPDSSCGLLPEVRYTAQP